MSQHTERNGRLSISLMAIALLAISLASPFLARAQSAKCFEVLSATPTELVVRIAPQYQNYTVVASSGQTFTEVTFAGGSNMDSAGAPGTMKLLLPLLAPNRTPAAVEILDQQLDIVPNIDLAPVPSHVKRNGEYQPQYVVAPERYFARQPFRLFSIESSTLFRTSYMERLIVSPVQYDANSRTLTRVRSLTLRIRFSGAASTSEPVSQVTPSESELYRNVFINGSVSEFYRSAEHELMAGIPATKGSRFALSASDGQWLQVETTDEGIYRITAQDLSNSGITGAIDTSTIELFGVGGDVLSERVTNTTGEWLTCPIEIHADASGLRDICFYAPGVTVWKYSAEQLNVDGLYHTINPYSSTGHFLLKIGGQHLGSALRVQPAPDTPSATPESSSTVFTAVTHQVQLQLENQLNWGREMLGEKITRNDVGPLQVAIAPPGYLPDSTTIRIGYDANIGTSDTGSVAVTINGQNLGTIAAHRSGMIYARNWDNAIAVPASIGSGPFTVGMTFASGDIAAWARLAFIEFMYRRSTSIGSAEIPFFVLGTKRAFTYNFQNAAGGELWDVTAGITPRVLASATGNAMAADVQGNTGKMRRLIAWSGQSLLSPKLSKLGAPTLRETIGQTGAEEIILAPNDLLSEARQLQQLREQGGQATEPMSAAVVNIEDVYREFGYGSRDITAIRDFMAYTFRHGATKVHYLLLLGGGHCDYKGGLASVPNWIPVFEVIPAQSLGSYRLDVPSDPYPYPDDSYYARLVDTTAADGHRNDVAVGRVSARTVEDADAFVAKTIHYEHGSDSSSWRSLATFLADDRVYDQPDCDPIDHLGDSEAEEKELQDRILVHQIYDVSYPVQQTSGGRKQPSVEQAIIAAMNQGTVLFSFVGHGNPNIWTHEGVLNVPSTIDRFTNFDRLAYLTTATCDFSEFDNYNAAVAGGVYFLLKPNGGAIGLLGTSRSVTGDDLLLPAFYSTLFGPTPESGFGTSSVGDALIHGKFVCTSENLPVYYLLGDPAQRLLLPKRYVSFDSLSGTALGAQQVRLPALSQARISGHIMQGNGTALVPDQTFNGTATVTLYDAPTLERATTVCPGTAGRIWPDAYFVEGPILYRGTATVRNGQFSVSFVVPKDVKLDSMSAKLSGYAFSDDGRSALGAMDSLLLVAPTIHAGVADTVGPGLAVFIGSRAFRSGDAVSKHSAAIVDVSALHGLNTSTVSVGHSFVAWVDDAQDSAIDLASTYVSKQDDYTSGTSIHAIELPAGHHTLRVRAFDTYNNPSFASVDFVAKNEDPYHLYELSIWPNPLFDHTTFSFTQPGQAGSLIEITLSIYTTDGRLARTIIAQTRESTVDIPWNGLDAAGNTVANGIYLFSIAAQNLDNGTSTEATGKCVVAR